MKSMSEINKSNCGLIHNYGLFDFEKAFISHPCFQNVILAYSIVPTFYYLHLAKETNSAIRKHHSIRSSQTTRPGYFSFFCTSDKYSAYVLPSIMEKKTL